MGRERRREMECFFLYITSWLTFIFLSIGCTHFPTQPLKIEIPVEVTDTQEHLRISDAAIMAGDFSLALRNNEDTASRNPGILEDQLLHQRGIIYVHPRNPERNFNKALDTFKMLKDKSPDGTFRTSVDVWITTIESILQTEETLLSMKNNLQKKDKIISRLNTQTGPRKAMIKQLNSQISQLESQVLLLETQLEKLKKVDLGTEEKKRNGAEPIDILKK